MASKKTEGSDVMRVFQGGFSVSTRTRETREITSNVQDVVSESGFQTGIVHVFCKHTSASLIICENADPDVRSDLEKFLSRLVPDGDSIFDHTMEGPDDMSAHVRTILTNETISVPITRGRLGLGTWQGIYLYEHRTSAHSRNVTVTIMGC